MDLSTPRQKRRSAQDDRDLERSQKNVAQHAHTRFSETATALPLLVVFENHQVFSPGGIERELNEGVSGRHKIRIVEFSFKILCVSAKHYSVTWTGMLG